MNFLMLFQDFADLLQQYSKQINIKITDYKLICGTDICQ